MKKKIRTVDFNKVFIVYIDTENNPEVEEVLQNKWSVTKFFRKCDEKKFKLLWVTSKSYIEKILTWF